MHKVKIRLGQIIKKGFKETLEACQYKKIQLTSFVAPML